MKKLWFPILLLPLTLLVILRLNEQNVRPLLPLQLSIPAISRPTPTPAPIDNLLNWKTYTNSALEVEFKYPNDWTVQEDPLTLANPANRLTITIVSFNPNIVGISYCEAYPKDSPRCEQLTISDGATVFIDWGEKDSPVTNAMFAITDGSGVSVALETNPDIPARLMLTAEDKDFFRTFLSTFKIGKERKAQYGDAATKQECLRKGGMWQKWGLAQLEYCQIPAPDGGQPCNDASECSVGSCISFSRELPGECQTYKNTFGCFSEVKNGEVALALCVD